MVHTIGMAYFPSHMAAKLTIGMIQQALQAENIAARKRHGKRDQLIHFGRELYIGDKVELSVKTNVSRANVKL